LSKDIPVHYERKLEFGKRIAAVLKNNQAISTFNSERKAQMSTWEGSLVIS